MSVETRVCLIIAVLFGVQIAGTLALYYLTTTDRQREWVDWKITLVRKWWRGECKWCRAPRLILGDRGIDALHRSSALHGNPHARTALDNQLCYHCAKVLNHSRMYGAVGGMLKRRQGVDLEGKS